MRRVAASVALLACLSTALAGCARPAHNVAVLGASALAFGGAASIDTGPETGPWFGPTDEELQVTGLVLTGVILAAVGGIGLLRNLGERTSRRDAAVEPPVTVTETERRLEALALEARAYAEDGDCARARAMSDEIWEADATYHRVRIEADPVISGCLHR